MAFDPSDPNKLIFTLDTATLPSNTLSAVDKIIDPETSFPGTGLSAAANGQRYLLVNDIAKDTKAWGNGFEASANDVITYNGTNWTVAFDASANGSTVQYVTNTNTGVQYKWTGTQWIDSYQGQYKNGFWKLDLAP